LVVSCTRPIKRTNDTGGLYSEAANDCLTYAGHIATQLWALVVRGCATKVEIFIIPAELLIAFSINSTDESGYEPLVVIESAWRDKEVIWHVQNNIITADQIPSLAKELFGDLIKVASGQVTESELSVDPLPTTAPKEDATVSGQNQPVVTSIVSTIKSTLTASVIAPSAVPNPTPPTSNIPSVSPQTVKAAEGLLALIDRDINDLLESGKVALQSDNTGPFEQIKVLTETLETLKKSVSIALANIQPSSTK
jgi:hypothetical protein